MTVTTKRTFCRFCHANCAMLADVENGKVVAVPGTEDALKKYLELTPDGPNAEGAKGLLTYIGSTVEINYGKQKKSSKK